MLLKKTKLLLTANTIGLLFSTMQSCKPKTAEAAAGGDAEKAFVAPGKYDDFYNIVSGGFNGQIGVYGGAGIGTVSNDGGSISGDDAAIQAVGNLGALTNSGSLTSSASTISS